LLLLIWFYFGESYSGRRSTSFSTKTGNYNRGRYERQDNEGS